MQKKILPVLIAGGEGKRLWPLSRKHFPKAFLTLYNELSLLQNTAKRCESIDHVMPPLIICNEQHRFLVAAQMDMIGIVPTAIILEPQPKDTAASIALASGYCCINDLDVYLLVLPCDHIIPDHEAFACAVHKAKQPVEGGAIVCFGVKPSCPHTGYGYIEVAGKNENNCHVVASFLEKPSETNVQSLYLREDIYWNCGIYFCKPMAMIHEMHLCCSNILKYALQSIRLGKKDLDFLRIDKDSFARCPKKSIDYAVMEKTRKCVLQLLNSQWIDVGTWDAVWEVNSKDSNQNVALGQVHVSGVSNSLIYASSRKVAAVDLHDLVVIETEDILYIASRDKANDIKDLINNITEFSLCEAFLNQKVYRPWGSYEAIVEGENFKVKRISINLNSSISMQLHKHRSEHWVVVAGKASVVCGEEEFELTVNQSTYIPMNTKHRLTNIGNEVLEVIEVQLGSNLSEDDIVRFDDIYGRVVESIPKLLVPSS